MARYFGGVALAVGFLLAGPGVATAGSIGWSFSTTRSEATIDGIRFSLPGVPLSVGEQLRGEAAVLDAVGNWTVSTNRAVVFGRVGPLPVEVTLTDTGSGESAVFAAPYFGRFDISEDHDQKALEPDPLFRTRLTLGGNVYAVGGDGNGGGLSVRIESVVNTPEPATALMAALGLAGVAAVRRRRP